MQIDTQFLETILTQAKAVSRLAGGITDASNRAIVIDELTSSINEIVRMLAELLGEPHPVAAPVSSARSSFAQAASLLDEVIYEQVVECIDLDALYRLEHSLTLLIGELDGIADDRVCQTAKAMLARALRRLPDDVWRYLRADSRPGVLPEGLLIDTIAHELGAVLGPHAKVMVVPSACSDFTLVVGRDDGDTQDDGTEIEEAAS